MSTLEISEHRFALDTFDSAFRYIREVVNSDEAVMTMVQGPTIRIIPGSSSTDWVFECGDYKIAQNASPALGFADSRAIAL